ncbi:NAA35 [Scenedesmus sp. PABB004]|nr:NAA35 [Scenedesmus sp. PABB004]
MREIIEWCLELGVATVSLYAFSIDNFRRPPAEVDALMALAAEKFEELREVVSRDAGGVASWRTDVRVVGDTSHAPLPIQSVAAQLVRESKAQGATAAVVNVCFAYTSTQELQHAVGAAARGVARGALLPGDVTPELLLRLMHTGDSPPVDLLVRTSGEQRLSDFLLWQSSHALLHWERCLWPEFGYAELLRALRAWQAAAPTLAALRAAADADVGAALAAAAAAAESANGAASPPRVASPWSAGADCAAGAGADQLRAQLQRLQEQQAAAAAPAQKQQQQQQQQQEQQQQQQAWWGGWLARPPPGGVGGAGCGSGGGGAAGSGGSSPRGGSSSPGGASPAGWSPERCGSGPLSSISEHAATLAGAPPTARGSSAPGAGSGGRRLAAAAACPTPRQADEGLSGLALTAASARAAAMASWEPVGGLLAAACDELEVGQMVHTSVFSLFEAMSAVEIGNPKMDIGARPKGDARPLAERPLELELAPEALLGVMDGLLAAEATWHCGGAAARTVYSSAYMMQPERTSAHPVLATYCRAVEAAAAEANHLVMTGCVCEEEDFNAHVAGLPLERAVTATGAAATGAADAPQPDAAAAAAAAAASDKLLASITAAADAAQRDAGGAAGAALAARLQFRRLLLQGLVKLKRRQKQDLDQAAKLFLRAQGELAAVRASLGLGAAHVRLGWDENINAHLVPAAPPRVVKMLSGEGAVDYYEALLGQLLRVCSVTAVNSYRALKEFLLAFGAQPTCALSRSALHIQVSYNAWLPPALQPPPVQHGGAAAHDAGGGEAGAAAAAEPPPPPPLPDVPVPAWTLSPRMLRASLSLSPDEPLGDDGELFVEQAVIAAGNMVQALLMNRSRCRRRLRRGLEDWANLYQHGLNADGSPAFGDYMTAHGWAWANEHEADAAGPLATWVEAETCFGMVHHLGMGFELDLYEPPDYAMVFWYIEVLCVAWQQAGRQLGEQQPALVAAPGGAVSKGKGGSGGGGGGAGAGLAGARLPAKGGKGAAGKHGGGGGARGAAAPPAPPPRKPTPESLAAGLQLEVLHHLATGVLRVVMALPLLGLYSPPELPFNTEAQRFEQRFASFTTLQRPDPLSYEQFVASTSTDGVTAAQLLALAADSFRKVQQAAALIKAQAAAWGVSKQALAQLAPLERVAATNGLAAALLARSAASAAAPGGDGAGAAPQLTPQFEFGAHKWFPTLSLKSASAGGGGGGAGGKSSSPLQRLDAARPRAPRRPGFRLARGARRGVCAADGAAQQRANLAARAAAVLAGRARAVAVLLFPASTAAARPFSSAAGAELLPIARKLKLFASRLEGAAGPRAVARR